ncbi:MAG: hypothetical protein M3R51_09385 [Candidatus Eremiobacteraeota bacterium]|nr:hypothetical protein [Candidatus Eremiobacteraeota bacterium]
MDDGQSTFSAQEAVAVQADLRRSLELGPEQFPLPAFIGMISDEIDQFRDAGRSSADVATVIKNAIGRDVAVADIDRFYAPADKRHAADPPA